MNSILVLKLILGYLRCAKNGISVTVADKIYIGKRVNVKGGKRLKLGENVVIRPYTQIWCRNEAEIGKGTEIGERCRISTKNPLFIGENVLISPNVYITDADHEYRDIEIPVIMQGVVETDKTVIIGDGSYIGINSVIVGAKIGKHCVVGANSVVTTELPDYSVAAGAPAKVVKRFNKQLGIWERINHENLDS